MRIGITECGDAGLDLTWYDKIKNNKVDGAVLITKQITPKFIEKIMDLYRTGHKIIVHCGCTGWGSTVVEPNVPKYKDQLAMLCELIKSGFPETNCVLRIDPIFPTPNGIKRVCEVIDEAYRLGLLPDLRVRISVLDEYKHVKERFKEAGFAPIYGDNFYAPKHMMDDVVTALSQYDLQFETCAEKFLNHGNIFVHVGCISERDLRIMGLEQKNAYTNPQNRSGCLCLSCKTELLENKCQCPHRCLYCYWRPNCGA